MASTGAVLVCDDEAGFRETISEFLRDEGHQVFAAENLEQARELLQGIAPDLILADLNLPDGEGLELLRELPQVAPECLFLIITAHASVRSAVEALRLGERRRRVVRATSRTRFTERLARGAPRGRHRRQP